MSGQSIGIVNLERDVVRLIHIKSNLRIVSKTGHTKASYFSLVADTATHVVIKPMISDFRTVFPENSDHPNPNHAAENVKVLAFFQPIRASRCNLLQPIRAGM